MKKLSLLITLIFACFALLFIYSSCSSKQSTPSTKPTIIVSVSPYNVWVQEIVGSTAHVVPAIPPKFNPHVYEATPKDMAKFKNASIWFSIGDPVEQKLIKTLSLHYKDFKNIDISKNLPLQSFHEIPGPDIFTHSCHHHDTLDRHFWLSPTLALIQCDHITHYLIELYPEHKKLYMDNFAKLKAKFDTLIAELNKNLAPLHGEAFLISHSALGYFAKEFHLVQIPIECEGKSPRPKDLQKIRSFTKEHKVLCAFTIEQFDNKGTLAIAKDLNVNIYSFDPQDPKYFNSMRKLSEELLSNK